MTLKLVSSERKQPNIIFILADDLGWNDVSWNNPDMPTENMERLAKEGIRLDQAYSQQVCTPSRAALLTGRYPFHIGRQKRALKPLQPTGLMLNLTTLPKELKELGYRTHMVGKWHLGKQIKVNSFNFLSILFLLLKKLKIIQYYHSKT